jgi:hypothetical protein
VWNRTEGREYRPAERGGAGRGGWSGKGKALQPSAELIRVDFGSFVLGIVANAFYQGDLMMWKSRLALFGVVAVALSCTLASQASAAPDSFFDIFLESVAGPGFPSSPTKAWVQNPLVESGPYVTTSELDLSLGAATANMGTTTLSLAASLPPNSAIGDIKPAYLAPDSFFDIFLECYNPSHGALPIIGTPVITPNYLAPDSFFDIFLECVGPTPGTIQTFNMQCAAADGVLFSNVGIQNFNGIAGKFDLCGQLGLAPGSTYVPGSTAMTITVTGSVVPEPSTVVLLIALGIGLAGWRLRRK